jgi:ubiquinone/menaquinone biosynthesis C-methylase UbiE
MSIFTSVDSSDDPARATRYLDETAAAESGMKHYAMAAHALRHPRGLVLDVGCGVGHDLLLLQSAGLHAVGVDPSAVLLRAASDRVHGSIPLVRAQGEALPFRDNSLAACRIERVLIHVVDPAVVVAEIVRCLKPGALLTAFEPAWDGFKVHGDDGDELCGWITGVRHPGIGSDLWALLESAHCDVLDRVEELSVWRSLDTVDRVTNLETSVERAVAAQRISKQDADEWVAQQRSRTALGTFRATMPKVLIVARKQ